MTMARTLAEAFTQFSEHVEDVTEETFSLFSQDIPSNDLGIINDKARVVSVQAAGRDFEIRQSSGLLTSTRKGGTTGSVLWKVTPLLSDWISDPKCCLWRYGILNPTTTIVELGCGVAGLVGLSLEPMVFRYVLTDQDYVMKLLKENIEANKSHRNDGQKRFKSGASRKASSNRTVHGLQLITLDWETDSAQNLTQTLEPGEEIGLVLLCDCVYNDYLIQPLLQTCIDICSLSTNKQTVLMIAQQLRTDEVFQKWMETLSELFTIWRISDEQLPETLRSSSGYVIHLAILKPENCSTE